MKKLLIIHKKQFGYHTGSYQLALNLQKEFDITFICMDMNYPKFNSEQIALIYVPNHGNFYQKGWRYFRACYHQLKKEYDYRFMTYFTFCSLLKIGVKAPFILDFRTGSVHPSKLKRKIDDGLKSIEAKFFKQITVISKGLQQLLHIPNRKAYILPLGANILSTTQKEFILPNLFYVGTLNNRQIEKTIEGVAVFLKNNSAYKNKLTYHIVGDGYKNEVELLKNCIENNQLTANIKLHGRKAHHEIQPLFDTCNVGISFIPITDYYNHQPPTKTFEYVLSGMLCLATKTTENKKYINENNGVLCDDNANSFANALEDILKKFPNANSQKIQQSLVEHTWENISQHFKNYLINGK